MRDDILKFRRIVEILLEKGQTKGLICKEMGMSEPTLQKLLTAELDSFNRDGQSGMRASTLGIIQDFNKRHANDLNYAGIESAQEEVIKKEILPETNKDIETIILDDKEKNAEKLSKHPYFAGNINSVNIDQLPPDEFRALFCRVWLEAVTRDVLVSILSDSGYSGVLIKKIVV